MKVLHRRGVFLATVLVICAVCGTHSQGADIDEFQDPRDTSPPSISKQPKPSAGQEMYIMDARVPLELECGATGTPPPTYKWLKYDPDGTNPVELDPSDARIMINDGDLKVGIASPVAMLASGTKPSVVTEEDEGLYQCIAENSYGSALSKKINARIAFMDAFSWTSSKTVTAQIGETTVLECNPPNSVPPSYMSLYWTTGIPPQPIETTARVLQDVMGNLVFANAQPEDTKDYKCNAPNQFIGEVRISPVIQFIVLEDSPAPERGPTLVSKPPIETEVLRTKTLSLKCIAEGNPTPEITWTWTTYPGDRVEANGAGLKVRNVEFEDEGDYTCTASNGVGEDVSYTSTVTVRSAPYWDPKPPTDTTIAPKESVTITCQSGGSPVATVSWLINGKTEDEVEANPRRQIISGQGSGQIIVTNAETSDSAVFQCIANNVYGEEITNVFLNVLDQPIVTVVSSVENKEGSAVSVTCTVDANPSAQITWTKPDAPNSDVDHNEESSNGTSTLTLNPVNREHAGIYNCESSNMIGDMAQSLRVYVLYTPTKIPSIYTGPTPIYKQNEPITLTCEFEAQPLANIRWYYENGTEVEEHDRLKINQYPNSMNSFRPRTRSDLSIEGAVKNVDEGMYRCEASNSQGSENINFAVEIRNDLPTVTAIIIVLLACVCVGFIVIFVVRRKRRQRYQMETETDNGVIDLLVVPSSAETALPERRFVDAPALDNNQPTVIPGHNVGGDDLYANVTANFNFPRNKLEILNELGQGAFGRVMLAKATGIMGIPGQQDVAVKTLKESAPAQDKDDLLQEVALMKILKPHPNVVRLLGCCIETDPIYVIVEYMDKGNLEIFLRKDRNKNKDAIYGNLHGLSTSLTIIQLMKFADQVAKGMEYLSMQKCIHRDLAARNVLINKDLICKVSDFGLARDVMNGKVYQSQRDELRLPIRWMAVESISENIFSTESDVWAFGILLWEIITLGARPYPGTDTNDVINGLEIGMRMPCPKHCPAQIYNIMEACWRTNPKDRPTFPAICAMMQEILESETMNVAMETPEESLYAVTEISLANEKL